MKTRILVTELNDGTKTYTCEADELYSKEWWGMMCTGIGTILGIISIFTGLWLTIYYPAGELLCWPNTSKSIVDWREAIFDNEQDAKKCIDLFLKRKQEEKGLKDSKKVKRVYKIKYP